jgi:hypothetical protein
MSRRVPKVSSRAQPFVEAEAETIDLEPAEVTPRPSLAQRIVAEQEKNRARAMLGRKNAWINGLSGWGCIVLTFWDWPWHFKTVFWVAAVLLWTLAFFQWSEFIVNRRAARMIPDPKDLSRF